MKGYNEYLVPSPRWAEIGLANEDLTLASHQLRTQPRTEWKNMIQLIQQLYTLDIKHYFF